MRATVRMIAITKSSVLVPPRTPSRGMLSPIGARRLDAREDICDVTDGTGTGIARKRPTSFAWRPTGISTGDSKASMAGISRQVLDNGRPMGSSHTYRELATKI
jgi:hypothetical protein